MTALMLVRHTGRDMIHQMQVHLDGVVDTIAQMQVHQGDRDTTVQEMPAHQGEDKDMTAQTLHPPEGRDMIALMPAFLGGGGGTTVQKMLVHLEDHQVLLPMLLLTSVKQMETAAGVMRPPSANASCLMAQQQA